jgi:hypothetical protein
MPNYRNGDGSILRPELTPRPCRMLMLPVVRGYPVPWFVDWIDNVPEFRAMDHDKLMRAKDDKLCWVCGEPLGRYLSFVSGPMCGVSRVTAEPPTHNECGCWSAINCPFLNNPDFERREIGDQYGVQPIAAAGIMIKRNPGCTMVWTTREYDIVHVDNRQQAAGAREGFLFRFGKPTLVEWFARGRKAKRAEVEASVESGFPLLLESAISDSDRETIHQMRKDFQQYLPKK